MTSISALKSNGSVNNCNKYYICKYAYLANLFINSWNSFQQKLILCHACIKSLWCRNECVGISLEFMRKSVSIPVISGEFHELLQKWISLYWSYLFHLSLSTGSQYVYAHEYNVFSVVVQDAILHQMLCHLLWEYFLNISNCWGINK